MQLTIMVMFLGCVLLVLPHPIVRTLKSGIMFHMLNQEAIQYWHSPPCCIAYGGVNMCSFSSLDSLSTPHILSTRTLTLKHNIEWLVSLLVLPMAQ